MIYDIVRRIGLCNQSYQLSYTKCEESYVGVIDL